MCTVLCDAAIYVTAIVRAVSTVVGGCWTDRLEVYVCRTLGHVPRSLCLQLYACGCCSHVSVQVHPRSLLGVGAFAREHAPLDAHIFVLWVLASCILQDWKGQSWDAWAIFHLTLRLSECCVSAEPEFHRVWPPHLITRSIPLSMGCVVCTIAFCWVVGTQTNSFSAEPGQLKDKCHRVQYAKS